MAFVPYGSLHLNHCPFLNPQGGWWSWCEHEEHSHYYTEYSDRARFVESFWIDRYEVSSGEYRHCLADGGCRMGEGGEPLGHWLQCPTNRWNYLRDQAITIPATCVTMKEAEQYCAWKGKRLCLRAEWLRAARGTNGRIYPWGDLPTDCSRAVFSDGLHGERTGCGLDGPGYIGLRPDGSSPYGVHDMAGNVAEYVSCADGECQPAMGWQGWNDAGIPEESRIAVQGSSFRDDVSDLPPTIARAMHRDGVSTEVGFRCCVSD